MTCKELIEYLSGFNPEELVEFLVVDPKERLYYKTVGYFLLDEDAVLLLEITEPGPMDDVLEKVEDTNDEQ